IPRAGAPADERSVCEPPGGNGEDLRSTRSLRHPTRRCRTPGARVDPPRAGEWRGGRPTTTIRCRRFRPRENGRRPGKGHGVSVEGPGTPGGEDRGRSRGNGETRGSPRRPRDDAGRSPRRTRPGDRAHGEDRQGTGHEGPQGGRGRTRGAAAARGSPAPRTRTGGPGKGIGTTEPPALRDGGRAHPFPRDIEGPGRETTPLRTGAPGATPSGRSSRARTGEAQFRHEETGDGARQAREGGGDGRSGTGRQDRDNRRGIRRSQGPQGRNGTGVCDETGRAQREQELHKRESALEERAGRTEAERKRHEESVAALRASIQDRAAKLEAMKSQLAAERADIQETRFEHKAREAKLKETQAKA